MMKLSARQVQGIAWGMSGAVTVIAVVAWAQVYFSRFSLLSVYQLFPLLGLIAFSLMWSHYIASLIRQYSRQESSTLRSYFEWTSSVVLVAILLHPGLLAWQLWRDGLGLPPGSTKLYVGASAYWAILIALLAWTLFLLYELRRVYGARPWWRFVQYGSDGAMILIFFHALRLGGNLQGGWFRVVWYFYGVTLLGVLAYTYGQKLKKSGVAK